MEPAAFRERYATLSARQREVLVLRCRGTTNEDVARQLFLQERTVKNHMTRILARLGLQGRRGSAAACLQIRTFQAATTATR